MSTLFVTTGKSYAKHVEGDIWEEGGRMWTIKNGIKKTVTKMDEVRKSFLTPMACPHCNRAMKHWLDEKMWAIHKLCFNCTIDMEHEIQKAGKWEEYEKEKMVANARGFFKDLVEYLEEEMTDKVSKNHVTEDGIVEKWKDVDGTRLAEIKHEIIDGVSNAVKTIEDR
jgi:glutaredoxin